MASNKQHDNTGIGSADQEAIRRLGERPRGTREPPPGTRYVPAALLKPGRAHDRSKRVSTAERDPHTSLGNTVESTGEGPNESTHDNK